MELRNRIESDWAQIAALVAGMPMLVFICFQSFERCVELPG